MRYILYLAILLSIPSQAYEIDKVAHFSVSYGLAISSTVICKKLLRPSLEPHRLRWACPLAASSLALIPGIFKELSDDRFDWRDMEANVYGVGAAAVFSIAIDF